MYCALKLGDICFIESLVGSLIASAVLTAIVTGAIWLMNSGKRQEAAKRYEQVRPAALGIAKRAFFDADYVSAGEALQPLVIQGDKEAERLMALVNQRLDEYLAAAELVKAGKVDEAVPRLLELARNGDTDAQWLIGLLFANSKTRPDLHVQGIEWLAIAAARGFDLAKTDVGPRLEALSPLEAAGIREHVAAWTQQYEARKEAAAMDGGTS